MNLAILGPLRYPISEPFHGGLEMHTHLLVRVLAEQGHDVTLFAHPGSDPSLSIQAIQLFGNGGFGAQASAYRDAMERIRKSRFDAVHNNSIHFLPPLLAGRLSCPMVTTLHTPPYKSLRWAGRFSKARNHTFVSISQHLHDVWEPHIGQHEVIHNGIEPERWSFSPQASPKTAIWYGRFTPEKGAEYAIMAARKAGFKLTMAGPVYDQSYFDTKVAPELDEDISYAGHLDQESLVDLIGKSSVGIVTSVWDEPFGLVYLEMPACGTPVAAFDSGAAREIITPATGAIVAKRDVGALAQVLGELERKDRGAARQAVVDQFGVDKMVGKYLGLYR